MSTIQNDKRTDGVINVYKEKGYTSHDVVAKLRGILKIKKIGHTGTLDPDAEGVLPVCIGNATKLCDLIMEKDKEYIAELILGKQTDTQDISGRIINESKEFYGISQKEIEKCIAGFVGEYDQIPPMYSAVKVNGKKLYELARKGIEIERKPRKVNICSIEILSIDLPVINIKVRCSRGTYIRTLCNDIGEQLLVHGCMGKLLRTESGKFNIKDSIKIDEIEKKYNDNLLEEILIPTDEILDGFESLVIHERYAKLLMNGNALKIEMFNCKDEMRPEDGRLFKIYGADGQFKAVYQFMKKENIFKPKKMF